MRNVQIDGNLLGGGAYTVYGGYLAGTDALSKVSNIAVTNNRFTTRIFPRSRSLRATDLGGLPRRRLRQHLVRRTQRREDSRLVIRC